MSSTKDQYTFIVLNVLIIDLRNSPANFLFEMFSFLISDFDSLVKVFNLVNIATPPEDFLSKNLLAIEARTLCYPSYFGFIAILNAVSRNISSEAVLLVKSLKISIGHVMLKTSFINFVLINIS